MQSRHPCSEDSSQAKQAIGNIGNCLRKGCVICIEHTPSMAPRFAPWEVWGKPSCYSGDENQIYLELDNCLKAHHDHHIRLNIEDISCRSRFSLVVHSPSAAGA